MTCIALLSFASLATLAPSRHDTGCKLDGSAFGARGRTDLPRTADRPSAALCFCFQPFVQSALLRIAEPSQSIAQDESPETWWKIRNAIVYPRQNGLAVL